MTRDEEKANQANAPELLLGQWNAWRGADEAAKSAKRLYEQRARALGIQLCQHCSKPMPEYDTSMQCDGCNLPWGWNTPDGRRAHRAARILAEIERLRAERARL